MTSQPGGGDAPRRPTNFIREIIDADQASGKHGGRVVTRFPPEPNGFLHIGHAKAICLNFGIARDYGGRCHLRFDDTNPTTEDTTYVEAIQEDVRWLGFRWDGPVRFASDYFDQMYAWAEQLVEKGLAYVDSLSQEQMREYRGTPYEPGRNSPDRDRPVAENLDLLRRMKAGEFPDGAYVLRARIDMASPNIVMRDPPLYRILHARHHRTGDAWCLYPMYDYAHCLEDAIEGVTHSLCTLEFENNREIYDWIIANVDTPHTPRQIEFARLNLDYTVMSKRRFPRLVDEGHVSGWDDPRMPTLAGLRRRGVPPEAIRAFCDMIGVAKTNSTVDIGKLEHCIRDELNTRAPRVLAVLRPLPVTITNWPAGEVEQLDAPLWPEDVGKPGRRPLPFSGRLLVERDDFAADPPKGWHRLAPGREVRLRYGYLVRCEEVVTDPQSGEVVELRCTYDPATRGGAAPDGRKVKGTIHWVSAEHALRAEVRLYDRLFRVPRPGADVEDFVEDLDPDSLVTLRDARVEPSLATAQPGTRWQFERQGYFVADSEDSRPGRLVFNRIVTLRDRWARKAGSGASDREAARVSSAGRGAAGPGAGRTGPSRPAPAREPAGRAASGVGATGRAGDRERVRAGTPELSERLTRYRDVLGLPEQEADVLSGDLALARFFEAACARHDSPRSVARWLVHDVLGALGARPLGELPFDAAALGDLVALVDGEEVSGPAAKQVLAEMMETGGDPSAIVGREGLARLTDEGALGAAIDAVLAQHPDELARYRGGEVKLLGFFMGAVMRATRGAADPGRAQELLREKLG